MRRIVVLGSGEGTNFSAIVEYAHLKKWNVDFFAISDVPTSGFIQRAKKSGIAYKAIDGSVGKKHLNEEIFNALKKLNPYLVVLAGYMRILPPKIVKEFENKIINIHPALLPSFKGAHAIEEAMNCGVKWTGVTVHYVDEGVDTGPIIAQAPVPIFNNDTIETLEARIHETEHAIYPIVIERILGGEVIEGAFECQQQGQFK